MVEIFDQSGEVKEYIPVSERQAAFLAEYGPAKGYQIETQVKDFLGIHEGLAGVYKAALESGQGNSKLPAIDTALFCFEAKLVNERGCTVAQASALRRVDTTMDIAIQGRVWEAGETAALQRLMARLGHGSDTLLADEMGDMAHRGLNAQTQPPATPADDAAQPQSDSDNESVKDADSENQPETPATQASADPKPKDKTSKPSKPTAKTPKTKGSGDVAASVLRQVARLAAQRGVEPPEVSTQAEAKESLKKLRDMPAEA